MDIKVNSARWIGHDHGDDGYFWRNGDHWLRERGQEVRLFDIAPSLEGQWLIEQLLDPCSAEMQARNLSLRSGERMELRMETIGPVAIDLVRRINLQYKEPSHLPNCLICWDRDDKTVFDPIDREWKRCICGDSESLK